MAEAFPFELVSPEQLILSAQVAQVLIPATDGEMTVMKDHAPTMTTVRPGLVEVTRADGSQEQIFVDGGFADINANGLSLLAEVAVPVKELNSDTMDGFIKAAQSAVGDAQGDSLDIASMRVAQLTQIKTELSL